MEKKLEILKRVGKRWNSDFRYIRIYEAPIKVLTDYGLVAYKEGFDAEPIFTLDLYCNVNTGEVELKSDINDVTLHSGELVLRLDNNIIINPVCSTHGYHVPKRYSNMLEDWSGGYSVHKGYIYSLSEEQYLSIAKSTSLVLVLEFAYLKRVEVQVDEATFQQIKDLLSARFSNDVALVNQLYEKYSTVKLEPEVKNSGGIKHTPISYESSNSTATILGILAVLGVLFFLLRNC